MVPWIITFLVVAAIAGLLGFSGLVLSISIVIVRFIFFVCLMLAVLFFILHYMTKPNKP
jgi:uncharacterized membrane protein YtjA (UPF0391 family)